MNHGFLILTHFPPEKILRQVERMAAPNHRFFIHIDKKKALDETDPALQKLRNTPGVEIVTERVNVQWGSFRIVEATLALMRVAAKDHDLSYLHLLSGECLFVKSGRYLDDFFERNRGKEFLQYFPMPQTRHEGWGPNRYDKYHLHEHFNPRSKARKDVLIRHLNSLLRKSQRALKVVGIYRKYPKHYPLVYAGSAWWSLTRECCAYVLKFIDENPGFVRRFRHTQLPDEMFFHTIIMASPFAQNVESNNLRYIVFREGATTYAHAVTMEDADGLREANVIFARKFTDESTSLIQHLQTEVWSK